MRLSGPPSSGAEEPNRSQPRRADAKRNRMRILEAAEALFAARGTSASTEEIARKAGVGIGTVFRHFPTKESLIEAIIVARVERIVEDADALAITGDPATAFFDLFTRLISEAEAKKTYAEILANGFVDVRVAAPDLYRRLRENIGTLLARAQNAGAVRADIGVAEAMALLAGAVQVAESARGDHAVRDRSLAVFLDGLRPAQLR